MDFSREPSPPRLTGSDGWFLPVWQALVSRQKFRRNEGRSDLPFLFARCPFKSKWFQRDMLFLRHPLRERFPEHGREFFGIVFRSSPVIC